MRPLHKGDVISFVYSSPPFHITGSKKVDESCGGGGGGGGRWKQLPILLTISTCTVQIKMKKTSILNSLVGGLAASSVEVHLKRKTVSAITAIYLLKYCSLVELQVVFTAGPSEWLLQKYFSYFFHPARSVHMKTAVTCVCRNEKQAQIVDKWGVSDCFQLKLDVLCLLCEGTCTRYLNYAQFQ